METEAEIEVMLPLAQESLGPPEVGRGKEEFFLRAFRENMALPAT